MHKCSTCNSNIISNTSSLIGGTHCNEPCPEQTPCEDITSGGCVFYSGSNLGCSGVNFGDSVSDAIIKIDTKLCGVTDTCLFKISSNDTCCGYFQTKILAGESVEFTIANEGGCETLTISEKCWGWNNVLNSGNSGDGVFKANGKSIWANAGSIFQTVQYSNIKGCSIKLRGTASVPVFNSTCLNGGDIIFVLPIGFRPVKTRVFAVNIIQGTSGGCSKIFPCNIFIDNSGSVTLFGNLLDPLDVNKRYFVALDGIEYETS